VIFHAPSLANHGADGPACVLTAYEAKIEDKQQPGFVGQIEACADENLPEGVEPAW
jgi:hypothetical protein